MQLRPWFLKTRSVVFCLDDCLYNQAVSIFVFLSCRNQASPEGGVGGCGWGGVKSGIRDIFFSFFNLFFFISSDNP